MSTKNDSVVSISSNSISSDESVVRPPQKKKTKKSAKGKKQGKTTYPVKVAHVPKRTFQQIHRMMRKNKPIIELKTQTLEKTNCNRFILNQIEGHKMETVSPESTTRLIWEMRERLQRREYGDLAKLICIFTEMPIGKARWYPTFLKYCLIALMYDPLVQSTDGNTSKLMEMFLDGVIGCSSDADKKDFLQDVNRLPTNIHVTKYDNLWNNYPMPNQLTKKSVDELCEILNKRIDLKPEIDADSEESEINSDWETYDENSSEDNETTTEPENIIDLDKHVKRIQYEFNK